MSFLKRIFGNANVNNKDKETYKSNATILDLLNLDLNSVPDKSFIFIRDEKNQDGNTIKIFEKKLDFKEFDIFETVELKLFETGPMNVLFKSSYPDMVSVSSLKKMVDEIYSIYGYDFNKKGAFTSEDKKEYFDEINFGMLFSRDWIEFSKYKYGVAISRNFSEIQLTIWGVGKQ